MNIPVRFHLARYTAWAVLLLLSNTGPAQGQAGSLDTDASLKLHFDFDEDFSDGRVLDVSGNGNDGWQFDPTNWITAGVGAFGTTGAQFTYVGFMTNDPPHIYPLSQYIGVTNLSGIATTTNATISFWARFDTNEDTGMFIMDNGYSAIYAGDPAAATNSWSIGRFYMSYLNFVVYPPGGGELPIVSWPNDVVQAGGYTSNLSTTRFHLYTVTVDCLNDRAVAYYDGLPYMTNTIGLPWIHIYGCPEIPWLCIGAMSHDGTPQWGDDRYPNAGYFTGRLDDIRIYNRTLTATEVQALAARFVDHLSLSRLGSQQIQAQWPANTNAVFQVEYAPSLPATNWNLLGPLSTNYFLDSLDQPGRFYRVRVLP